MRQMAILIALLFLRACPLTLASDAARMALPSGMNSSLTIRYPELAQAPALALIGEGLRATYENCKKNCEDSRADGAAPLIRAALILS